MKRLIEQRYLVKQNFLAFIGLCLCVYFSWHAIAGERGIIRLYELNHAISEISQDVSALKGERIALEGRVVRLRPASMDRDFLEERIHSVLGLYRPDEQVILYRH